MSVVIRLKVPIEIHYTVIPMGTSKVNSSQSLPTPILGLLAIIPAPLSHTKYSKTAYSQMTQNLTLDFAAVLVGMTASF